MISIFVPGVECAGPVSRRPAEGVLDAVGETPVVRLYRYLDDPAIEFYAKLESANPGGSAKDRPAKRMIEEALRQGLLWEGSTVVESSSGNMGIGLAQACRYHGLRFICVVDPNAQPQNVAIIRAYGAEIERVTEPENGDYLTARLNRVRKLIAAIPDAYWPNQYSNRENPNAHFAGTIRELDDALDGHIDFLFVATSSTGTIQGCWDYLAQRRRNTRVVAVDAAGSILFGGVAGPRKISALGAGCVPDLAKDYEPEALVRVSDVDCVAGCRRLVLREAILAGASAGGVVEAVRSAAPYLRGKRVAAILHDSGTRYLKTVFSDRWVASELGCSPKRMQSLVSGPRPPICP